MTKLLTCIAVLQLVDRKLITLDSDVSPYLPALASQPILSGFDPADGSPILRPRTRPILVRHLLTHSSGCGYASLSPELARYLSATGREAPPPLSVSPRTRTVEDRFGYPLLFEPGQGWAYGSGIDWAGRLVEALGAGDHGSDGGTDLEAYMRCNILEPLGIPPGAITFRPAEHREACVARLAGMATRDNNAAGLGLGLVRGKWEPDLSGEARAAFGGEGAYAALDQYVKVLQSLLLDDGRLLSPATARFLFEGLLNQDPEAKRALRESMARPQWVVGWVPTDTNDEYDWSAGGLLTDGDSHPYRKKGFLQWGGVFNLSWVSH